MQICTFIISKFYILKNLIKNVIIEMALNYNTSNTQKKFFYIIKNY